jgi:hypothetical protein
MGRMLVMGTVFSFMLFLSVPQFAGAAGQQNKMKQCNAEADAKGLGGEGKGEARKAFMKECLSSKPTKTSGGVSQQEKMKTCNKEASEKKLKGDERKKFMSSCLSG